MGKKPEDPMKGTKKKKTEKGPHNGGNEYHGFGFGEGFKKEKPQKK